MIRNIYHGSEKVIEKPIFGYGKAYNDYGLGFYCTENIDMAKEWAVGYKKNGYANCYSIEMNEFKVLNLNSKKFCVLNWLAILLDNREFEISSPLAYEAKEYILDKFLVEYEKYDIIIGYRADDSYFSFASDFLNGIISYRQLTNALYLGKLGIQIVLKSKKAFECIEYIGSEVAKYEEWYSKKDIRDKKARRQYLDLERYKRQKGDIYIMNIIDEEMDKDDMRLR